MSSPYFSLIIPAFNRARQLQRALKSVLEQDFYDYEVVVVDDCSEDATVQVGRSFTDPRIRVLQRTVNGGPCQARNSGIDVARGQWLVMFDSDFSFRDAGALRTLACWCESTPKTVGNCISACAWDNGWLTPRPFPPPDMEYESYLPWLDRVEISEYFNCVRREVFSSIRYAQSRAWETSFHIKLAQHWQLKFFSEPLVLVHTDATNRLTTGKGRLAYRRMLADARDRYEDFAAILAGHGLALKAKAPRLFYSLQREAMKQALLAGFRRIALRHARECIRAGVNMKTAAIFLLGMLHRSVLAWVNTRD